MWEMEKLLSCIYYGLVCPPRFPLLSLLFSHAVIISFAVSISVSLSACLSLCLVVCLCLSFFLSPYPYPPPPPPPPLPLSLSRCHLPLAEKSKEQDGLQSHMCRCHVSPVALPTCIACNSLVFVVQNTSSRSRATITHARVTERGLEGQF